MTETVHSYTGIAFCGYAGSGKSTAARMCRDLVDVGTVRSFAGPLKRLCYEYLGENLDIPWSAYYGTQEEKNAPLEALPDWSGRKILQFLGTECFRNIHKDVWAKALHRDIVIAYGCDNEYTFVDDLRFQNEAEILKDADIYIVKLTRSNPQGGATQGIPGHASEREVELIHEDLLLDNRGEKEYLKRQLKELLCRLNFSLST